MKSKQTAITVNKDGKIHSKHSIPTDTFAQFLAQTLGGDAIPDDADSFSAEPYFDEDDQPAGSRALEAEAAGA